jgi:hypothetical protein
LNRDCFTEPQRPHSSIAMSGIHITVALSYNQTKISSVVSLSCLCGQ